MTKNLVRDWMTANPITIGPRTTLLEAYKLMTERRIRRLPVMNEGRLVGIVTLGDVREFKPSEATILSVFDTPNALSHLTAEQAMTLNPIAIAPDATIYAAARVMRERRISGLPVVADAQLIGVITESDIFRALVRQMAQTTETPATAGLAAQHALVSGWMTPDPVTIEPKAKLPEAHRLMSERHIRRLPVIERGQLVGIVTFGDLRGADPSPATSLGAFELTYLMNLLCIDQIMTRDPITIAPGATLTEAAALLLAHKIGSLPVVDKQKLVGIITESDIFRALVARAPANETGAQATPGSTPRGLIAEEAL